MDDKLFAEFDLARPFIPNGGFAFTAELPAHIRDMLDQGAFGILLEDGRSLGPSEAVHASIRQYGKGLYSVWHSNVYFSASDNTDCNANARTYRLAVIDFGEGTATYQNARQRIVGNDREILRTIRMSEERNNSFFLNFFRYYNGITRALKRNSVGFPDAAIELGTGRQPYTALRFLIEGTSRFIANDIMDVTSTFERSFIEDVRGLLDLTAPDRCERLDRLLIPNGADSVSIHGLEAHGNRPFEDLDLPSQEFDLILSTSVLEHVMKPKEVVEKMIELLKPGGHIFHSIDLRDHRDFRDPLAFLYMSADEYASINTENRLRASDWLELFQRSGFTILDCAYGSFKSLSEQSYSYDYQPPVQPWVNDRLRAKFHAPFDRKELWDLATLSIHLICRKER